jgi:dTMP kinase
MAGLFISIEGIEGVGKSTNLSFIESMLIERGIEYISTREPGGTDCGERIRELLLDKDQNEMNDMTELLLMFAARAQHVGQVIKPALESGKWVVCDRFTDSSYAYQGGGRGVSIDLITQLESIVINGFQPDCTILLDLAVETGLSRAENVGEKDRFELEHEDFFNRVRNTFLDRANTEDRIQVVNASLPIEEVQNQIAVILNHVLDKEFT